MDQKTLSELPIVFQIVAGFGLFFGTFMLAIGGWLWKTIKPKLPDSLQLDKEVPVPLLQVMDADTVRGLTASIDRLRDHLIDRDADSERELERGFKHLDKTMSDLLGEVERVTKLLQQICKALETRTLV